MSKKLIVNVALACISLLIIICGTLFYVSWTTMTTMAQLREENYRLALEAASYRMRLEGSGVNVEAIDITKKPKTDPVSPQKTTKIAEPATPAKAKEPEVKKETPAVTEAKSVAKPEVKPVAKPAAPEAAKAKPRVETKKPEKVNKPVATPVKEKAKEKTPDKSKVSKAPVKNVQKKPAEPKGKLGPIAITDFF